MKMSPVSTCYRCALHGLKQEMYAAKLLYRWNLVLYACKDREACLRRVAEKEVDDGRDTDEGVNTTI
jgi:hypothetical protein